VTGVIPQAISARCIQVGPPAHATPGCPTTCTLHATHLHTARISAHHQHKASSIYLLHLLTTYPSHPQEAGSDSKNNDGRATTTPRWVSARFHLLHYSPHTTTLEPTHRCWFHHTALTLHHCTYVPFHACTVPTREACPTWVHTPPPPTTPPLSHPFTTPPGRPQMHTALPACTFHHHLHTAPGFPHTHLLDPTPPTPCLPSPPLTPTSHCTSYLGWVHCTHLPATSVYTTPHTGGPHYWVHRSCPPYQVRFTTWMGPAPLHTLPTTYHSPTSWTGLPGPLHHTCTTAPPATLPPLPTPSPTTHSPRATYPTSTWVQVPPGTCYTGGLRRDGLEPAHPHTPHCHLQFTPTIPPHTVSGSGVPHYGSHHFLGG